MEGLIKLMPAVRHARRHDQAARRGCRCLGSTQPALTHAINIIRNNPNTYNFPIAAISSKKYNDSINGLKLYDWVGMANYSISTQSYLNNFTSFQSALLPTQRAILVPQAATGGFMSVYGQFHEPNDIFRLRRDPCGSGLIMPPSASAMDCVASA